MAVLSCSVQTLVLADVHGNLAALDAVLDDARARGFDDAVFLGDAVGYAPHVGEVIARLRDLPHLTSVLGNHDAALLSLAGVSNEPQIRASLDDDVRGEVRTVLEEQVGRLDPDALAWLAALPTRLTTERFDVTHGTLLDPWRYLQGDRETESSFGELHGRLGLFGHTHVPRIHVSVTTSVGQHLMRTVAFESGAGRYAVPTHARALFNPGSVGQPRDGHTEAAYGLVRTEGSRIDLECIRVAYPVEVTQQAIRQAGYPKAFAERLAVGA